jgi:hypothetical protein
LAAGPAKRDGIARAVDSGRPPPKGRPVRSDREGTAFSRVTRSFGPRSIAGRSPVTHHWEGACKAGSGGSAL